MKVPQISTNSLVNAFIRLGFEIKNKNRTHIKIVHYIEKDRYAAIPYHKGHPISPGTLRNILKSTKTDLDLLKTML